MSFSTHDPVTTAVPFWIVGGLVLFGPITVWIDRAAIRRWDAAHPDAGTAFG